MTGGCRKVGFVTLASKCPTPPNVGPLVPAGTEVALPAAEYVDCFNHRRLHGEVGLMEPAEFETNHWASITPEHYPDTHVPAGAGSK